MYKLLTTLCFLLAAVMVLPNHIKAQERDNTEIIAAIKAQTNPGIHSYNASPDRHWGVQVTTYDCTPVELSAGKTEYIAYEMLKLADPSTPSGDDSELIAEQVIYCNGMGLGEIGLGFLQWSPDSRYFYYTDAREAPLMNTDFWLSPVIRVDTEDRSAENVGSGIFSRDRTRLAAVDLEDHIITLYDTTQTEPLASFDPRMPSGIMIDMLWLPDISGVIVVEADDLTATRTITSFIDVRTLEQTTLLETDVVAATAEAD